MRRAILGLAFLAPGLIALSFFLLLNSFDKAGPSQSKTYFLVERGDLPLSVSERLQQVGAIKNAFLFRVLIRLENTGPEIKAGEYEVPAAASYRDILRLLTNGPTVVRKLTVPEGVTTADIIAIVKGADGLVGEVPQDLGEGTLLPETYHYSWGDTREGLISRMRDMMSDVVTLAMASKIENHPIDTPTELITLASIVERETSIPSEQPRVAAVFVNRLKRGMLLQSDPTVIYAITRGKMIFERRLTYKDLKYPDPYNTYFKLGLPPGPIANPGKSSLMAAANPLITDELFFVADGFGGHVFSKSLSEHNRNVAKWRQIQRERGLR